MQTDQQALNELKRAQLDTALLYTYGHNYQATAWEPCKGGSPQPHVFKSQINNTYTVIARFLDTSRSPQQRAQERLCTQLAGDMDIGPTLYYHDPEDQLLLIEHLSGKPLTLTQLHNPEVMIALASQLNIWHEAPSIRLQSTPTLKARIIHLSDEIDANLLTYLPKRQITALAQHWQHILDQYPDQRPCHGDLNPRNMIQRPNGTLKLIDWSESGLNHPYIDVAMVAQYLPENLQSRWLSLITGHAIQPKHHKILEALSQLLTLNCHLWALQQAQHLKSDIADTPLNMPDLSNSTETLPQIQNRWLNNQFNVSDPQEYLKLAYIMYQQIYHPA